MIFRQWQQVLDGTKTQTRRLVKSQERAYHEWPGYPKLPIEFVTTYRRIKWRVGKTYAIQPGRGKKAVGRFLLLAIRREKLQDIGEADMEAEGITPSDFTYAPAASLCQEWMNLWDSINTKQGTRWAENPEVWVLEFELVKGEDR